jgi:hypothetical protein
MRIEAIAPALDLAASRLRSTAGDSSGVVEVG